MKVLDSMNGILASCGDPIMHFALLIGICFVPKGELCMNNNYDFSLYFLIFSHTLNSLRFIVSSVVMLLLPVMPSSTFSLLNTERLLDFFSSIV